MSVSLSHFLRDNGYTTTSLMLDRVNGIRVGCWALTECNKPLSTKKNLIYLILLMEIIKEINLTRSACIAESYELKIISKKSLLCAL